MTLLEQSKAPAKLAKCKTLADAERAFGLGWDECDPAANKRRDRAKLAEVWGCFDGWNNRPETTAGIPEKHHAAYRHGVETGRRISRMEQPA